MSSWNKKTLFVVLSILVVVCAFIAYTLASLGVNQIGPTHEFPYATNITFTDGGNSNDIVKITIHNTLEMPLNIEECIVNNQSTKFQGDLRVPGKSTGNLTLTVSSGTLIGAMQYTIVINPYATNGVFTIWTSQRYIYYHMVHPDATGPVEEAVIAELHPSYYSRYYSYDEMGATVQNTGDYAITITDGSVNGQAPTDITGQLTIGPNETGQMVMSFPARTLLDQMLNQTHFYVKLNTLSGNQIEYIEPYYFPEP